MPAELYNGTLSLQAMLPAIRLFQSSWTYLTHFMNDFLTFVVKRTADGMAWEPATAKLLPPTLTDDMNNIMAKLQLMQGQQISKSTGLASVGLDYKDEIKQMLEEERIYAEEQEHMQAEMQQAQQMKDMSQAPDMSGGVGDTGAGATGMPAAAPGAAPGAPPAGGMPGQMPSPVDQFLSQRQNAPNVPRTPEDLQQQAQLIANQLLSMPESVKDSELIKLKRSDATMHALVTSIIDDIRQQARSQGGAMVMAQQFGQGQPQGAPPV